ncbi:MAG: hypothetical protein J6Y62_02365 [Clostridia bacterium]|nr:hypothetical protein [Clostridia bacterium]
MIDENSLQIKVLKASADLAGACYAYGRMPEENAPAREAWGYLHGLCMFVRNERLAKVRKKCEVLLEALPSTMGFVKAVMDVTEAAQDFSLSLPSPLSCELSESDFKDEYQNYVKTTTPFDENAAWEKREARAS